MTRVKPCEECGETPRTHPTVLGQALAMVPIVQHTTSCSRGRCGASHNPGVWPYTARCVIIGAKEHGPNHKDKYGQEWPGEFITLDQELENRDD